MYSIFLSSGSFHSDILPHSYHLPLLKHKMLTLILISAEVCYTRRLSRVCLSVCLLATSSENYADRIFMNILSEMHRWTPSKSSVSGSESRIFWKILQHSEIWIFFRSLAHISWKTNWILVKILPQMFLWTRKYPVNFESHPKPDSGWERIHLLGEVCALRGLRSC